MWETSSASATGDQYIKIEIQSHLFFYGIIIIIITSSPASSNYIYIGSTMYYYLHYTRASHCN